MDFKNIIRLGTGLTLVILASLLTGYQLGLAAHVSDVAEVWVNPPLHEYSYVVDVWNATYFVAINGTNGNYDGYDTNASVVINNCIGNMTTGGIFIKAGVPIVASELVAHPNILITGEIGFISGGSIVTCSNGTWVSWRP